jgi:DNA-binding CsgD family transcriptional regulator
MIDHGSRAGGIVTNTAEIDLQILRGMQELIGPALVKGYQLLLESAEGCAQDEDERFFGEPGLGTALLEHGLVQADGPTLKAIEPILAFEALILSQQRNTLDRQSRISGAQQSAFALRRRLAQEAVAEAPRLVTGSKEIVALSNTIANTATEEYLTVDTSRYLSSADGLIAVPSVPSVRQPGVRHRAIYDAAILATKAGAAAVDAARADGGEIRILSRLPMQLRIADSFCALVPLSSAERNQWMHLNSPVVVAALRDYFNLLWERATPFGGRAPNHDECSPEARDILLLLNQGLKDETIARRLDLNLRTVRRRVTGLLTRLGVTTRFAAGAAAQRRGWLGD